MDQIAPRFGNPLFHVDDLAGQLGSLGLQGVDKCVLMPLKVALTAPLARDFLGAFAPECRVSKTNGRSGETSRFRSYR